MPKKTLLLPPEDVPKMQPYPLCSQLQQAAEIRKLCFEIYAGFFKAREICKLFGKKQWSAHHGEPHLLSSCSVERIH